MMNKERELLESCLDEFQYQSFPCTELVTRIKELLAQPEQDQIFKVIEKNRFNEGLMVGLESSNRTLIATAETKQDYLNENERLTNSLLEAEDKIQELLAQPEQEPVAWCWEEQFGVIMGDWGLVSSIHKPKESKYRKNIHPLYMSPQKVEQEPSDTEIITAYQMLVRRKLGLQEKNEVLQLGEPEFKVCENKIDGSCPLHNLQCQYPECEE
jgi:hypothetical protein